MPSTRANTKKRKAAEESIDDTSVEDVDDSDDSSVESVLSDNCPIGPLLIYKSGKPINICPKEVFNEHLA
jgi:hypothetical protein